MTRSFFACLLLSAAAGAQAPVPRDSTRLNPVVVTASRSPESLNGASASVTVLRGDDLLARGVTSVADALREVPGLSVVASGPQGGATSLFARGGNSNFVKVLVDGVPVNEAGGSLDFANLRLTNVDRIEIVRGPVSVLYGSDAVAGVVQIVTRSGADSRASLDVRAGSRETVEARAEVGGADRARWSAGGSHLATRGLYDFNNRYRSDDASVMIASLATAPLDARVSARFLDATYHFPTTGSGMPTDSNAFTNERRLVLGGGIARRLSTLLVGHLNAGWSRLERASDNSPDSPVDTAGFYSRSESESNRRLIEGRLDASFARSTVTAGLERVWQQEHSDGTSRFAAFPSSATVFDERRVNSAAFAQVIVTPASTVRATFGGRVDDNDRFGRFGTWRAGAVFLPRPGITARLSAGTAFREPAFAENFSTAFTNGNLQLSPERTRSWEAGVTARPAEWVRFGAVYFDQHFDNLIQYVGHPFGSPLPNYENLASATARGIELEMEAQRSAVFAHASVTALQTRVREAGTGASGTFVEGEPLLRRPARSGGLTLGYRSRHSISLTALYTGRRSDLDFAAFPATPVALDPFTRLDAAGSLAAGIAALTLRIENVGDVHYENVHGFRTAGRTIFAGVRIAR